MARVRVKGHGSGVRVGFGASRVKGEGRVKGQGTRVRVKGYS
jgi:hypothetical protein